MSAPKGESLEGAAQKLTLFENITVEHKSKV